MKENFVRAFLAVSMLLLGGLSVQAQTAAPVTVNAAAPDTLVRDLTNEVLATIRSDPSFASGDLIRLQKLVDEKVFPYVDFQKMTQLAVGRGWRTATPDQRATLTREFRTLLLRTYSGALSQVKDHQVQLKPFRAQPNETDVTVRTSVVPSRGEPIQLDYRLEKQESGWKIYDVNVIGVWLVENYKTQFAGEISAGGVDGLIKTLSERNRRLEQAARKA